MEMSLRIPEVKELIKKLYLGGSRQSILLLGGVGIGKTTAVHEIADEIAKELGMECIRYDASLDDSEYDGKFVLVSLKLNEIEPCDLVGVPDKKDKYFEYKPPKWAYILSKNKGILFLDEITTVQRADVESVMNQLLLDKLAGFVELNEDVLVIGAGNRPEHTSLARKLASSIINRVMKLDVECATVEEWGEWMTKKYGDNWDKSVYAFLLSARNFFVMKGEPETLDAFATPRQWSELALKLSKIELSDREKEAVVCGTVGTEAGMHYLTFIRNLIPELDEFKKKPIEYWKEFSISQKYLMALRIASSKDSEFIVKLLTDLFKIDREFIVIILRLCSISMKGKEFIELIEMIRNRSKELKEYIMQFGAIKMGLRA